MRLAFIIAVVSGVLVGGAVAAVRLVDDGPSTPGAGDPVATATPLPAPERAVMAFVDAWEARDAAGIVALLATASRARYTETAIAEAFASFDFEATVLESELSVESVSETEATLRARVSTAYFGTLEYAMHPELVREAGVYRVLWSPRLIHPELSEGLAFRSLIERPVRGAILDRKGAVLAETRDVRMAGLNRSVITDRGAVTAVLAELGLDSGQVDAAFASPLGQNQRVPVGPVPDALAEAAIRAMQSEPGIIIYFEQQRVHPLGAAAAHVVGYTRELTAEELEARPGQGFRPGDRVGASGLEAGLEPTLAGQIGAELQVVDRAGSTIKVISTRAFVEGEDVVTTLDAGVQRRVFALMGVRSGAAVVVHPGTNEVRAMVSTPSFDPDAFERNDGPALSGILGDGRAPLTNRAAGGLYSAGSTFKLITAAAGLDAGVVEPGERIFCGATWDGVDPPRRNWEGTQGPLTVAEGLMRSCNPVFYEIGLRLYNATEGALSEMARRFGLGSPTGIGVIAEQAGLVPDAAWKQANRGEPWYPGDEVNLAIGQGDLLLTPLQLANAYSTFLAGTLRTLSLVVDRPAEDRGVLGLVSEHRAVLLSGLELVTGPGGTAGPAFALAGYFDFGGKSGTAEDAGEQQHVLFVAFSPADAPGAVAAVVLDDGESGSLEAGPIARDAVLAALASP